MNRLVRFVRQDHWSGCGVCVSFISSVELHCPKLNEVGLRSLTGCFIEQLMKGAPVVTLSCETRIWAFAYLKIYKFDVLHSSNKRSRKYFCHILPLPNPIHSKLAPQLSDWIFILHPIFLNFCSFLHLSIDEYSFSTSLSNI